MFGFEILIWFNFTLEQTVKSKYPSIQLPSVSHIFLLESNFIFYKITIPLELSIPLVFIYSGLEHLVSHSKIFKSMQMKQTAKNKWIMN